MSGSNVRRSGEHNEGFANMRDGTNIFNDEDYKELVETNSSGVLRPESPYQIPEQAKPDKTLMTFGPAENAQRRDTRHSGDFVNIDTHQPGQRAKGIDTPAFENRDDN